MKLKKVFVVLYQPNELSGKWVILDEYEEREEAVYGLMKDIKRNPDTPHKIETHYVWET